MFKLLFTTTTAWALMVAVLSAPVAAEDNCTSWSTANVQREEGKQWTASVCAKRKDRDAFIEIVCYGSKWNVRYQPVLPDGKDPGDGVTDFIFQTSTGQRRVALGFEGLDGAFATDLDDRHPLFEMLMSGDELAIVDTKGKVATQTYTLKGSRRALNKLKAQKCEIGR